jgi:hypothetical protein
VGVAGAAGAGWFLLRNERLYGSPTADDYLLERYQRRSKGTLVEVLTDGDFREHMAEGIYGSVHPALFVDRPERVVAALAALLVAGAVAGLVRRAAAGRRHRADRSAAPGPTSPHAVAAGTGDRRGLGPAGWALVAAYCAAVVVATASFFSEGGSAHPRYLFGIVPVLSALLARAIAELPLRRLVLAATVGMLATVTGTQIARYPEVIDSPTHIHPFPSPPLPGSAWDAALALTAVASAAFLVALALGLVTRRPVPAGDPPSGPAAVGRPAGSGAAAGPGGAADRPAAPGPVLPSTSNGRPTAAGTGSLGGGARHLRPPDPAG